MVMETSKRVNSVSFYVKLVVILGLMIVIGMLPPIGQITPYGMKILGIFIGCLVGWGFGYQVWASILGLIVLGFTGSNTITGVFSAAYGNQSLVMVFFGLIFCFGIEQCGLMSYIANWILARKIFTKDRWMISLGLWIACAVCSALITNTLPVIILMWGMFYNIVNKMGIDKRDPYVQITLVMMCVVGYTGSVIMPYAGWNLMCYSIAKSIVPDMVINLFAHTALMAVLNVLIIATIYLISRFVLDRKTSRSAVENVDISALSNEDNLQMTTSQKIGALYLVLLAVMLFVPNVAPKDIAIVAALNNLGATGSFALVSILLMVTYVDGKPLMDPMVTMKQIPWQLYFLLGTALYLAGMIATAETGIAATLSAVLQSTVGKLGLTGVIFVFVAFGCIATNAVNNVVCVNLFIPIGASLVVALGGDAAVLTALLCPVLYLGLLLPSGSVVGGLMHGNSEWIETSSIYKYASIGCAIVVLWCVVVGIPLGGLLF